MKLYLSQATSSFHSDNRKVFSIRLNIFVSFVRANSFINQRREEGAKFIINCYQVGKPERARGQQKCARVMEMIAFWPLRGDGECICQSRFALIHLPHSVSTQKNARFCSAASCCLNSISHRDATRSLAFVESDQNWFNL